MKRIEILTSSLLLLMPVFFACTIYEPIPIEVMRSSEIRLPMEGKQIALLYRNFKFPGDTLQHYYRDGEYLRKVKENQDSHLDSLAVISCLQGAAEVLVSKGSGPAPSVYPIDMMPEVTGEKIPALPPTLVRKIVRPSGADYLISLETFSYFYARFPGNQMEDEFRQVVLAGLWAVYDGHSGGVVDSRQMVDTLYWNKSHADGAGKELLPPRIPAIQLAAGVFGENYASKFHAGWIKVDRTMIIPPLEEFRLAAAYATEQKWNKAKEIWERFARDHFGKLAITAWYNLALASEINDDLEKAAGYIDKAYETALVYKNKNELQRVLRYREIIGTRLKEIEKMRQSVTR